MEVNQNTRSAASEAAAIINNSVANTRFKERRQREVQSDVVNEAVFYSPVIKIDRDTQAAVMQYRDTETGEIKNEYPNKKAANNYAKADATAEKPDAKPALKADAPLDDSDKTVAKAQDVAQDPVAKIDEDA